MSRSRSTADDVRRTSLRLGLQTGVLLVGVLAVVGLLLFVIYERAVHESAAELLRDTTAHVDAPEEAPPGVRVVVVTPSGRRQSPGLPRGLPDERALSAVARDGRPLVEDLRIGGREYTVRTVRVGDRTTQAVLDLRESEEERSRILTSLLIAGGVGVVLAALVATWLARRAMAPLAESLALQRRFVADASHELRTPLTLLSTRVQMAARRARRDDGRTAVSDIEGVVEDTDRLTGILDDLLLAADARSGPRTRVDLSELVRACADSAAASAEESALGLEIHTAGPVLVDGVEASLRRAVTALIDNALEHAESRVQVSVEAHRTEAVVSVADDGPGIPPEVAPRIFERFTTARAESPGGRRHYGIGLALVADVAAAHDGRVAAGPRTDRAHGAVLSLTLPRLLV